MRRWTAHRPTCFALLWLAGLAIIATGCSTAPKYENREAFLREAESTRYWFEANVPGLRRQIDNAAGYAVFPAVGQYGLLVLGGKFGRGVLHRYDDSEMGWAYINTASAGLQIGAQGYKMLMVIQDEATLRDFQANRLTGNVGATAVAAEAGASSVASFDGGVAVYQGARSGLMAGASIGLDYIRFEPM